MKAASGPLRYLRALGALGHPGPPSNRKPPETAAAPAAGVQVTPHPPGLFRLAGERRTRQLYYLGWTSPAQHEMRLARDKNLGVWVKIDDGQMMRLQMKGTDSLKLDPLVHTVTLAPRAGFKESHLTVTFDVNGEPTQVVISNRKDGYLSTFLEAPAREDTFTATPMKAT